VEELTDIVRGGLGAEGLNHGDSSVTHVVLLVPSSTKDGRQLVDHKGLSHGEVVVDELKEAIKGSSRGRGVVLAAEGGLLGEGLSERGENLPVGLDGVGEGSIALGSEGCDKAIHGISEGSHR
jgi:hypothetical protein